MIQAIELICPVCQQGYIANNTRLKFGRQTTCSRKCSYQLRSKKLEKDLTGILVGKWTVLGRGTRQSTSGAWYWKCLCDCGKEKEIFCSSLTRNLSKSCGCLGAPGRRKPFRKSREYGIWSQMKGRCLNPLSKVYKYYGGRGITICERWLSFENFYHDMGVRPFLNYSIERINNDGNYEPSNCKWIPRSEQSKNRNKNHYLDR